MLVSILLIVGFVLAVRFGMKAVDEYVKSPKDKFTKWLNLESDDML